MSTLPSNSSTRLRSARILCVSVGRVGQLAHHRTTVASAIRKQPISGSVAASLTGLAGDEQGDRVHHGGVDKAICVFPSEHYAAFERRLGRTLGRSAFGENLTTVDVLEADVCIGDRLRVGSALCEVSLPRNPCYRVGARHHERRMPVWMEELGATGFYLRVVETGEVHAGARIALEHRPHPNATVAEANRVMHRDRRDTAAIRALLEIPQLGASWRRTFERRVSGEVEDPAARRFGPVAVAEDPTTDPR